MPRYFDVLIDPYDNEETIAAAEAEFPKITVPTYTGAGWYGYTYKTHLAGAQTYFSKIPAPKKMLLTGPAHPDRPLRALRAKCCAGTTIGSRASTAASCRSRRSPIGSWAPTNGGAAPIGRCRKRNGRSFISRAGSG